MSSDRKGLANIRTMRGHVDKFRAKTPQGALVELAQLAQEKIRLRDEMKRWGERIEQIQSRLKQINKMEKWLYRFVEGLEVPSTASGQSEKSSPSLPPGFQEMSIRY